MMFGLMRSIVFDTLESLSSAHKSHIFLFPAVLVLRNFQVHICTTNSGNMVFYIETSVNKPFALLLLWTFHVQLNDSYIQLRRHFDNLRFQSNYNVVENMVVFNDCFDNICVKNERSGLNIFLFSYFIFILFLIYFSLFYF